MDDETAPSLPVEAPEAPEPPELEELEEMDLPQREREQDHNETPFPWEALHKSLTRRLRELVDTINSVDVSDHIAQAAHHDILHELEVLDHIARVHSEFHVDLDD